MTCAWEKFIQILPQWMKEDVDRLGKDTLQELHLRLQAEPELVLSDRIVYLKRTVAAADLAFCVQAASRYSPWASDTICRGYITAPGGHRIGISGMAVYKDDIFSGIREVTSLCIRIARDFPGISAGIKQQGSLLILGAPGWGKTTLLRDYIRNRAYKETVAVVDERGELFPDGFLKGKRMDILVGSKKADGIERLLCTMAPQCIAVDEVTAEEDCQAICYAVGCGVNLIATAHAGSMDDFYHRPVYRRIADMNLFDNCVILRKDRSFSVERIR